MNVRIAISSSCLAVGIAACGSSGTTVSPVGLGFKPSNFDLTGFDLSAADDVILNGSNCPIDAEMVEGPTFLPCQQDVKNRVVHKILTLADKSRLSVFVVRSLQVTQSTVVSINRGHIPVAIVALDKMELIGSIDVAPGYAGGPVNTAPNAQGVGPGGGPAGDATGLAGGGASYCGQGGKGGTNSFYTGSAPVAAAPAYGTPELVPLIGGSAGGNAAINDVGTGGGALQLVAGNAFVVRASGFVNAGGGGGTFGGQGKLGAGGGGSGGSLLIESPSVTIEGKLAANGGGGGQGGGNADPGEPGHPDQVAQGGHKANEGAPAGNGSFAASLNGSDGPTSADQFVGGGGGGGGAGRIRINSKTGQATLTTAVISPAATTACFSQGTVK